MGKLLTILNFKEEEQRDILRRRTLKTEKTFPFVTVFMRQSFSEIQSFFPGRNAASFKKHTAALSAKSDEQML